MNKNESSAQKWIQKGRRVWVKTNPNYPNPFQDAFLEGQILGIEQAKHVRVFLTDSKHQFKVPMQDCLKLTYGTKDVADMVDLEELNEPQLLYNIKRRYVEDSVFTYCGPTLLIINPYVKIQRLFNDSILQEYQLHVFSDALQYKTLIPHIFGLAAFCLWQLFDNQRNQSIVISGQSGAGKTQNTKYCLKFLASLGKNMKELINESHSYRKIKANPNLKSVERTVKKTSLKAFGIEEKILGCNEILQAFGNSKTIRNDNSSRFGKLILLVYGQTQIEIKSAFIISYLLQKSRIVSVSEGERNYHIFYYLIKGTSEEEKKRYFLKKSTTEYYYLNQSSVITIPGLSDEENFHLIKKEFELYLNQDEIEAVMRILSVVLTTGNIRFKKVQTANTGQSAVVENPEQLQIISQLLNVSQNQLKHSFHFKTRKMGLNVIDSPLKYEQALSLRDSFAKNIYEKTFSYLIKKMNEKIQIQQVNLEDQKNPNSYRKSIGLLDIFGFQVLNTNSLEQFFINFANQKLQQLYVSYIFKEQQNQFMRQGLRQFSHDIGFQDNKPIIDLFQNYPLGIFHLVNQSSQLNQDDKDLPSSIEKNHSKNQFLKIPKAKRSCFEILHSCSPVSYITTGFTLKNKDQFPQQLLANLQKTTSPSIHKICVSEPLNQKSNPNQKNTRNSAKKFLGSKFLNSMNTLIEELYSCDCHFVRCIKPNSKKSPKLFNSEAVLQSLRYLGVLDSIIIRKLGYIYRRPFKEFYKKFYELDNYIYSFRHDVSQLKTEQDFKRQSQKVIYKYAKKQLEQNNILLGHKKILIKQSTLNHLELMIKQRKRLRISVANRFKTMYKNAVFRTKVKTFLKSIKILKTHMKLLAIDVKDKILNNKVLKIQNVVKKFLWQRRLQKIKEEATKSVTKIAAFLRMKKQRRIYLKTKEQILSVQSNVRLFLTMGQILRHQYCFKMVKDLLDRAWKVVEHNKAVLIQKIWKGFHVRKKFRVAIEKMKKNLKLAKLKKRIKRALFQHNYNKFQEALNKYRKPIIKLQAIVRGKFLHRTFNNVKKSTLLIQKVYRRHLKKKFYLAKEWQSYKQVIQINQTQKLKQLNKLGLYFDQKTQVKPTDETLGILKRLYPSEMIQKYRNKTLKIDSFESYQFNQIVDFSEKNTFQLYLIDYDSVANYGDDNGLSLLDRFQKIKSAFKNKGEYAILAQLTQNKLIFVTNKQKAYRIDLNGKIETHQFPQLGTISSVNSSDKGTIILFCEEQNNYQWGVLKQQTCPNIQNQTQTHKILNSDFKKQTLTHYSAKGQTEYILSSNKIIQRTQFLMQKQLQILELPIKTFVKHIAASYQFAHFLTTTGTVYSKGKNHRGELGLGFQSSLIKTLTLNQELKKLKQFIEMISVGFGHTIVKSKLGYVYGWGDNSFGQILNNQPFISKPKRIEQDQKPIKAYQISAGLRASYLLTQSLKIYGCGASLSFESRRSGNLIQICYLQEMNARSRFLNPIKLRCLWSLEYSVLMVNAIDFSRCKQGAKSDAVLKYTKTIAKEWIQNTIYPPYHEFIDNCLNLSDLRKLKFKGKNESKNQNDKKHDKMTKVQELKLIIDFRKTSSILKETAKVKIEEFLDYLQLKRPEDWSAQQKQMYETILREFKSSQK